MKQNYKFSRASLALRISCAAALLEPSSVKDARWHIAVVDGGVGGEAKMKVMDLSSASSYRLFLLYSTKDGSPIKFIYGKRGPNCLLTTSD